MLSPRVRGTAPGLEVEDREFLAGAPPHQDQQKTNESSEACQRRLLDLTQRLGPA